MKRTIIVIMLAATFCAAQADEIDRMKHSYCNKTFVTGSSRNICKVECYDENTSYLRSCAETCKSLEAKRVKLSEPCMPQCLGEFNYYVHTCISDRLSNTANIGRRIEAR